MPDTAQDQGYTLLELLVVIGIIGLIAAVAVPVGMNAVESATLRSDSYLVMAALRQCQNTAVTEQRTIRLGSGNDAFSGCGDADLSISPATKLSLDPAPAYFADGTSSGGRVVLTRGSRTRSISLAWLTGAASLDMP